MLTQVKANTLRALAVASAQRVEQLPGVPTLAELGITGVDADAWIAYFAPAKVPQQVVEKLWASIRGLLANPAFAAKLKEQGLIVHPRSPAEMALFIPAEIEKWAAVVKAAGLKAG